LSRPAQRRDETARQLGAVVRARSGNHADGLAVRRARFPDSGNAAGRAAVDLAARPQDPAVRHPRHRRGELSRNARDPVYGASGPRQCRHPPSQPRSFRRLPQVPGIPRLAGRSLGAGAGRGIEGTRAGGSVRLNSASVQNWILPVAALVAWEILGRADLLPRYLSTPSAILAALWEIALTGELIVAL